MPRVPATTPIKLKLQPAIAAEAPARATSYGLLFSTFVGVLVWNDFFRPDHSLRAIPREAKLVRQPLSASLRGPHRRMARARARAQEMSLNAYLEALLASQLARPRGPLVILNGEAE